MGRGSKEREGIATPALHRVGRMAMLCLAIASVGGIVAIRQAGSQPRLDRPANLLDCRAKDYDTGRALVVALDGKIVVAGGDGDDFALVRYMPDGSVDGTFGDRGLVLTDFGSDDEARAVALAPDGKIVVAGTAGGSQAVVARYDVDGRLDPTFGGDGMVVGNPDGRADFASAVALQPDGRIIVSGAAGGKTVVTRYLLDGSLDPTFGEGGTARVADGGWGNGLSVAVAPDGDILTISGVGGSGQMGADFAVVRLNGDGSLDRSFDGDGVALLDFGGKDEITAVAAGPGDTVVAVGSTSTGASGDPRHGFAVGRLRANGSPDATFGRDGRAVFSPSGKEQAFTVTLDPEGRIVVAGSVYDSETANFGLVRFRPDGSVDDAFGTDGLAVSDFGGAEAVSAVAVAGNGGVVAAGTTGAGQHPSNIAVARYHPDGSPDEAFDGDGLVITDLAGRDCP